MYLYDYRDQKVTSILYNMKFHLDFYIYANYNNKIECTRYWMTIITNTKSLNNICFLIKTNISQFFKFYKKLVKIQSNANIVLCIVFCIQEFNRVSYTDTLSDFIYKE